MLKIFSSFCSNNKAYCISLILILLTGIILRAGAYFAGHTLWLDECSLSLSIMHKNISGLFEPLEHTQSAPVLFMLITKAVTNTTGINEFSLRFIPFIASLLSLPVFYIFSKKFLNKKYLILIAFLLFSINSNLVYYGVEFKQYSSDVLICMLVFLFFNKLNFSQCGYKKAFIIGLGAFTAFLFSFPSLFITGAFILYNLINTKRDLKKTAVFLSSFIILMPVYYLFVLYPSKLAMMETYKNLWQSGFVTLNPLSLIIILKENISYFFSQSQYTLFGAILLTAGFIYIFKNIKQNNKTYLIFLYVFACIIAASFLEIYPIKERTALYLLPFFLILILKPVDYLNFKDTKHIIKSLIIILLFIFFISSYNTKYFADFYKNIGYKKGYGDKLMLILKEKFKTNDVVIFNDASSPIYEYNSMRHNFSAKKTITIRLVKYDKDYYIKLLNTLPKNNVYWFYYPNEYSGRHVVPFIEEWANDKNIINSYKINNACLLNIKI